MKNETATQSPADAERIKAYSAKRQAEQEKHLATRAKAKPGLITTDGLMDTFGIILATQADETVVLLRGDGVIWTQSESSILDEFPVAGGIFDQLAPDIAKLFALHPTLAAYAPPAAKSPTIDSEGTILRAAVLEVMGREDAGESPTELARDLHFYGQNVEDCAELVQRWNDTYTKFREIVGSRIEEKSVYDHVLKVARELKYLSTGGAVELTDKGKEAVAEQAPRAFQIGDIVHDEHAEASGRIVHISPDGGFITIEEHDGGGHGNSADQFTLVAEAGDGAAGGDPFYECRETIRKPPQ